MHIFSLQLASRYIGIYIHYDKLILTNKQRIPCTTLYIDLGNYTKYTSQTFLDYKYLRYKPLNSEG